MRDPFNRSIEGMTRGRGGEEQRKEPKGGLHGADLEQNGDQQDRATTRAISIP